jgi:hypothetical protein
MAIRTRKDIPVRPMTERRIGPYVAELTVIVFGILIGFQVDESREKLREQCDLIDGDRALKSS